MTLNLSDNKGLTRHPRRPAHTRIRFHNLRYENFMRVRPSPSLSEHFHWLDLQQFPNRQNKSLAVQRPIVITQLPNPLQWRPK